MTEMDVQQAGRGYLRAWTDVAAMGISKRAPVVDKWLDGVHHCFRAQDVEVKNRMCAVAGDIVKFKQYVGVEDDIPTKLSASTLVEIMDMCSEAPDAEAGWQTVTLALDRLRRGDVAGVPNDDNTALIGLLSYKAARAGKIAIASSVVTYLAEREFEVAQVACIKVIMTMLNKPMSDALQILQIERSSFATSNPSAVAIYDAFYLARTRAQEKATSSNSGN